MPRAILDEDHIHPTVRERIARHHADIVEEVRRAAAQHAVLVVGMAINPWPRVARRTLERAGIYRAVGATQSRQLLVRTGGQQGLDLLFQIG